MTRPSCSREFAVVAGALLVLAAGGCVAGVGDEGEGEVTVVDQAIIQGTTAGTNTATVHGIVAVKGRGFSCSGSLLFNDVVITAAHCTTTTGVIGAPVNDTLSDYKVVEDPDGRSTCPTPANGCQTRTPTRINRHPTADVALLFLGDFMAAGSTLSRFDFARSIFAGTDDSLIGAFTICLGYGHDVVTRCSPLPAQGTGAGTLRQATLQVATTSSSNTSPTVFLDYFPNGNQIPFAGDSGGACLVGGTALGGVFSNYRCNQSLLKVTDAHYVSPGSYRSWVQQQLDHDGQAAVHTASTSNISGNRTTINDSRLNNNSAAFLYVTANWNPNGAGGTYNAANLGVLFNSGLGRWQIFNQNGAAVPVGAAFNYWVPKNGGSIVHTVTSGSIPFGLPHVSRLSLGAGSDNNPNERLIVMPRETTNDRAVGVWFDTSTQRWFVYNEDISAMPIGAKFNVIRVSSTWGGFTQTSTTSTIGGNSMQLDNPNLNNEPRAQFVVTHNFKLGGGDGGTFHNKALGVWYDNTAKRWNIFNQDLSAMPANLTFNVMVRP